MAGEAIETLALLNFNGDIADEMGNDWQFTGTGYSFDTEKQGYSGSSYLKMDAKTRIQCTAPEFALGLADFTIDYRVWRVKYVGLSSCRNYDGITIGTTESFLPEGKGWKYIADGHKQIDKFVPTGEWTHIAYVRKGDNGYYFINGELKVTDTGIGALNLTSDTFVLNSKYVDRFYDSTEAYYDTVRISRGARWTSDFNPDDDNVIVPQPDQLNLHILLDVNETVDLTGYIRPIAPNVPQLVWSSEDSAIASVDQSGKVTGNAVGITKVHVKTPDDSWSAFVKIMVEEEGTSDLRLSILLEPDEACRLKALFLPNGTDKPVVWSSSNPAVATVASNGKVTALAVGEAIISVQTVDGSLSDYIYVTVIDEKQ